VIPTFNRSHWVGAAIESVLSQSFQPVEIIVVDDGSTDETEALVKKYPVQYIKQSHSGPSKARNHGARLSSGNWLAFLDSDDQWFPDKLKRQVQAIELQNENQLIYTGERWIRNGKRVNSCKHHQKFSGWIYLKCLKLCLISPSSVMLSRDLFFEAGGFEESYWTAEDYDLWLKITSHHPVLFLDEELIIKYGGHEDQLSRTIGIDVNRVKALENRLADSKIREDYQVATRLELLKRIDILIQGYQKHGHETKATEYEKLKLQYE
jgi:glycosyltransferase involved in cell wall biosynthesis